MITIEEFTFALHVKRNFAIGKFDHINQMITLSVMALNGLHCFVVVLDFEV